MFLSCVLLRGESWTALLWVRSSTFGGFCAQGAGCYNRATPSAAYAPFRPHLDQAMGKRLARYLRWVVPILITAMFMVMLGHMSGEVQILSRYSQQYFRLLLAMGGLVATSWWVAVDEGRSGRLFARALRPSTLALAILLASLLALVDIARDVGVMLSLLPLILAVFMAWFASDRASSVTEAVLGAKRLAELALLAGAILAALFIAEVLFRGVLVRNLNPETDQDFARLVADTWPRPVPMARDGQSYRILGLADSFGQAAGHDNYHYALERLLNEQGTPAEVVNISVPGYELIDELTILQRFGGRYAPDLVLHGFFVGNDFLTPSEALYTYQDIQFRPQETGLWSYRPRNFWLFQWLKLYGILLRDRLQLRRETAAPRAPGGQALGQAAASGAPGGQAPGPAAQPAALVISEDDFLRVERKRLEIFRDDSSQEAQWHEALAVLDAIRAEVEAMESEYVMVIHPDELQVEEELRAQLETFYQVDLGQYDLDRPQAFLRSYCRERNIRCIDLLPALKAQGAKGGLYLPKNTHYNPAGHVVVAEEIIPSLPAPPAP